MDGPFSGRVALITGASGIGQALARRLATGGAVPGLGYSAHGQAAQALGCRDQDAARRPGPAARQVPAGRLGQPSQVTDLAAAILAKAYLTNQVISLDGGIYPR